MRGDAYESKRLISRAHDCALTEMAAFVDEQEHFTHLSQQTEVLNHAHTTSGRICKGREVNLGPLVGSTGGFGPRYPRCPLLLYIQCDLFQLQELSYLRSCRLQTLRYQRATTMAHCQSWARINTAKNAQAADAS